ncbi:hypothetical protein BGZ61DRAFT_478268 [Ilyonectria robusta]|uniref:uncharacterized protein n=1 Tax=Ilyonectria robusta TaxID=1079257 RepID=UPI001E8E242A|nr:uncharacterized protein BGZ61DRAFT_478268 [Ilyonectria robusta]KAH8694685.1 hypothetical protein BGZ61DRAFT_478268 [Ilyonectria robusta]
MDFARGSRRARHVAANANASANVNANANANSTAAANSNSNAAATSAVHDTLSPPGAGRPVGAAALVTPDAPPPLHRTPDQPVEQPRRAPPPNPFRLYRSK